MRYDSHEHLLIWQKDKSFPRIHDNIAAIAVTELAGRRMLDLGCSYGLLGARLLRWGAADVVFGIDMDDASMAFARAAGIPAYLNHLKIEPGSFDFVTRMIRENHLDVVIARRILPELFGHDIPAGAEFAFQLRRAGIKELVVEGRVNTLSATNPLRSIVEEVAMLERLGSFKERRREGAVSYLLAT